jgi:hypothetical protein
MSKQTTKLNAVEHAQKIVDELKAKRDATVAATRSDEAEMANISYEAHTGDQKAAAKLETLRERALRRNDELSSIDVAIKVAERKLAAAKADEVAAEQKRIAAEARLIIDRIDSLFASADTHFKQAFDALKAADGRIEELHARGFAFPTAIQIRTNALFALQTYLMALPKYWWNELAHGGVRFLAPHARCSFQQCWSKMAASIGREIAARLGETKQKQKDGENVAA